MAQEDNAQTDEPTEAPQHGAAAPQPALVATPHYRKSLLMIALEVVLISGGVFLGLMGEQWRERTEQRELANEALRRFRTEIRTNRGSVAAKVDYHAKLHREIQAYFETKGEASVNMSQGLSPVFFEQAAWDLAIATQALAYMDADLSFAISRVYTIQQGYAGHQATVAPTVMFGRSPTQDPEAFWRPVLWYLGDISFFDPTLLKAYDEILPRIDRALGESSEAH
jgi:uncharacterized protein YjeT (DUF2065 family)